jgi:hypothetical protein
MSTGLPNESLETAGYGPPGGGGYGPPPGGGPPGYGGGSPGYPPPGGGPPGYGPPPGGGFGPPGGYGPPGAMMPPGMMMGGPRVSPLAIISLICGLLSMPTCFCSCVAPGINGPLPLAALICGFMALGKIREAPQLWKGSEMAITGIVTGGLGFILVMMAAFTTIDESIRHSVRF